MVPLSGEGAGADRGAGRIGMLGRGKADRQKRYDLESLSELPLRIRVVASASIVGAEDGKRRKYYLRRSANSKGGVRRW